MNIKGLTFVALASTVSLMGLSSTASANCSFTGKVERVYQNASIAYVYMVPITSLNSSYYLYFNTSDPDLMNAAQAAKDKNDYVNVYGVSSSACTYNAGGNYGGTINYITRY